MRTTRIACGIGAGMLMLSSAATQAGIYKTIDVLGDPASEWAGIDPLAVNLANSGAPIAFHSISVVNDSDYVYIKIEYYGTPNPQSGNGVFLAVDSDNNTATGFDIFGIGAIGSDAGWQNDFPFSQAAGNFNNGSLSNASYGASPYGVETSVQQIRIPLNATNDTTGLPVFGPIFAIMPYSAESGGADYIGPVTYTLATIPEPASLFMLGLSSLAALYHRKRK